MGRPTLVSLAKELGVSRQTVSNVINAPHLVKPETRARVQAAIESSGYRPNVAAQALRTQRSDTIAMRVHPASDEGINGTVMDRFLHHVAIEVRRRGYRLLIVTADSYEEEARILRELYVRRTIDGCILTGSHADDQRQAALAQAGLPAVTFGREWGHPEAPGTWVDVDGAAGTRLATRELLGRGHRAVGFLGWPEGSEVGEDRARGWQEAMAEAGLATEAAAWRAAGDDRMDSGLQGMEQLVARGVDAVVCASDSLAVGALEALRRNGSLAGETAPVIGFDNTPVARALGLSSVDQPVEAAARSLCDALVHRLDEDPADGLELLQPELVLRPLSALFSNHPRAAVTPAHN